MAKKLRHKLIHGTGPFMFLRSMITSQISSWVDFFTSFAFYAWVGFSSAWATAVGAFTGGVANCLINYKFTFRMRESSYLSIGVKFFLVWVGSLLLNTFGTEWLTDVLDNSEYLDRLHFVRNLRFTIARLAVAGVVSVLWNFLLQRYFVFRANRFDNFIDRCHYYCRGIFRHWK